MYFKCISFSESRVKYRSYNVMPSRPLLKQFLISTSSDFVILVTKSPTHQINSVCKQGQEGLGVGSIYCKLTIATSKHNQENICVQLKTKRERERVRERSLHMYLILWLSNSTTLQLHVYYSVFSKSFSHYPISKHNQYPHASMWQH